MLKGTAQKMLVAKENAKLWTRGAVRLLVIVAVVLGIGYSVLLNVKIWWNAKMLSAYQAGQQDATTQIATGIVEASKAQGGIRVSSGKETVTLVNQQTVEQYASTTTKQ